MKKRKKIKTKTKIKKHIKNHKLFFSILLLSLLLLIVTPLIKAFSFQGYSSGYGSPLYYLQNDWVMFIIIFAIFFAVIYYSVNRTFNHQGVSAVIAAGIALLIAMTFAQSSLVYGFFGNELASWVTIITILVGIGFLIKFAFSSFGGPGIAITFILLWIILHNIDPTQILPYQLLSDSFLDFYALITSWFALLVLAIVAIPLFKMRKKEELIWRKR